MKIPGLIGASYTLRTPNYDCQRTINLFVESNELGHGKENEPKMMVSVPGQVKLFTMSTSPIRCIHVTSFGKIICAAGNGIYYLNTPDNGATWTSPTLIANLTTSTGPVSIADGIPNKYNGNVNSGDVCLVVVVDGSNYGIVFEEGTTDTKQLNTGNQYKGASFVTFQDGFFIFTQSIQSPTAFFANDPLNIDELDIVTVNIGPDYISRIISDHDILWVFGGRSSSVWQNTGGSDTSNTFQQIPGSYSEGGCAYPHTIAKAAGQLLWINADDRGYGQVFRGEGYRGVKISNYAVELWLQSYSLTGATAWTYQDRGHTFYILNVPGATTTWAYDLTENSWSERAFFKNGAFSRDLIENHVMFNGKHLCGDYSSGNVYTLSNDSYTLNGEPIYRMRTIPPVSSNYNRVFFGQVQVDLESGVGLDDDGYQYFTGYDTTVPPTVTALTNIPMQGNSPNFTFVDSYGTVQTPLTSPVPVITSNNTWSQSYTINGSNLTVTPTDFTIPTTQFATGNDQLTSFTFASNLAADATITAADIYASDWRGNNQQTTTPITNLCTDSINFDAAIWTKQGITSLPAVWNQYPSTITHFYRPSANTTALGNGTITSPENVYSTNPDSIRPTGVYATMTGSGNFNSWGSRIEYKNWGTGYNVAGKLYITAVGSFSSHGGLILGYTTDNGTTYKGIAVYGNNNGTHGANQPPDPTATNNNVIPFEVDITIPDLSAFQVSATLGSQFIGLDNPSEHYTAYLYDMVFVANAVCTDSNTLQNAPDGVNSGTYITESADYEKHNISTTYSSNLGDTTTLSCYYQVGDSSRYLSLELQDTPVTFTGSIATNQLTVLNAPTSGTISVGQVVEVAGLPPGTTITAGTSSPYTLSYTLPLGITIATSTITAYKTIAKAYFTPNGGASSSAGTFYSISNVDTKFMGSISGDQLTVSKIYSGTPTIGQTITGTGIPSNTTIIAGTSSPYTLSASIGTINNELITVTGPIGIYRCAISGTEVTTGVHKAIISLYDNLASIPGNYYVGNGASKLGIWGVQIQKGAPTKYIPSANGVSGVDYITPNLTTGTVTFNIAPYSGSALTWDGSIHGTSINPLTLNASYSYSAYPAKYITLGIDPQVNLSYSDDGGHTFGPERSTSMGKIGQYTRRCIWRRNGMSRARVWRFTCSEPVKFSIIGGEFKMKQGEVNG